MGCKKNIFAFVIIGIAGTVGHFIYNWSGENSFLGIFFPVSESVWEHLKLIFFPSVVYFTAEYFSKKNDIPENYIPASVKSIFCGMMSIITLFYVTKGIIGKNVDFLNILIYFISVAVMLVKRNRIIKSGKTYSKTVTNFSLFFIALFVFLFAVWSFNPPILGIFNPLS